MNTHLDLCSGIGGFALAARWTERIATIGFCEIDSWCQRVLAKNFPGVPIHGDINTLGADDVRQWIAEAKQVLRDDGRVAANTSFVQRPEIERSESNGIADERRTLGLTLLTAGYPCQPFSHAGKRLGEADDRHIWPAIAALVAELRPRWCLFENVAGHISLGLDDVLSDLETLSYTCWPVVVPACAVNAPHRRDRVWVMAHAERSGTRNQAGTDRGQAWQSAFAPEPTALRQAHGPHGAGRNYAVRGAAANAANGRIRRGESSGQPGLAPRGGEVVTDSACQQPYRSGKARSGWWAESTNGGSDGSNADAVRCNGRSHDEGEGSSGRNGTTATSWWAVEPGVGRVAHGISGRVDRLKGLGNAIVPQVAYVLLMAMLEEIS